MKNLAVNTFKELQSNHNLLSFIVINVQFRLSLRQTIAFYAPGRNRKRNVTDTLARMQRPFPPSKLLRTTSQPAAPSACKDVQAHLPAGIWNAPIQHRA